MRSSLFRLVPVVVLLCGVACQQNVVLTTPTDTPAGGNTGITSTPTPVAKNTTTPVPNGTMVQFDTTSRPGWLEERIQKLSAEPPQNPAARIMRYRFEDQVVYYETLGCCDQYTNLYDKNGKLICHPEGGITGKGDGNCRYFTKHRTEERLVWQDARQ
ncbi:hypothetical protein MTX78_22260 [Hymenobacter tibetensis]|uniref:DUF6970 domain-containing protein n=1 Tax=Hymenobacter tibetensis TaxID=497967 RepID=A0ABY4CX25_9BACT|nr:hypothetical protein [Hymenobacter tibetensis]UOG74825.1 hypothetical protein MTX78_22260 [Hymenobacter tibetensis]